VAVLAAVLVVLALAAVRVKRARERAGAPALAAAPAAFEVERVSRGTLRETRRFEAEVRGAEEALVSSRILAPVLAVSVREGDAVRRGQVLVRLEAGELEDAVESAAAAVSAAEVAHAAEREASARDRVLFEAKAIAQEAWDRSRASEAAAEARLLASRKSLDSAQRRREYALLSAPFDGVVARREVDPGDLAAPGKTLLVIVREGGVRVRVRLPGAMLAGLAPGRALLVESPGGPVEARVARVFPAMDATRLAVVEADLPAPPPGLVSGATVGVDVETGAAEGLLVPAGALLEGEAGAFVFRAREGRAEPVRVTIAARSGEGAAVTGDLREGDEVIVAQPSRLMTLAEGTPVAVLRGAAR
jgi:RND family efflux transporter MFP subunit